MINNKDNSGNSIKNYNENFLTINNNNDNNEYQNKVWYNDPFILFHKEHILELFPLENMKREQKINAITRLILLLSIIGFILFRDLKILFSAVACIIVLIFSYYTLNNSKKFNIKKENFSNQELYEKNKKNLTTPQNNNPIMNILLPEINDNPNKLKAAPSYNVAVQNEINNSVKNIVKKHFNDENIDEKLFKRENNKFNGDDFLFEQSMRQFHTMPNTQIPNNQKEFAEFCYGNMASCKDGDVEMCIKSNYRHTNM